MDNHHSPDSSSPSRSSSADDPFDPADHPISVVHPIPPPPDHVIHRLPPTPTLLQQYFPDEAASWAPPVPAPAASPSSSASVENDQAVAPCPSQPQQPATYAGPTMGKRFLTLILSLDKLLNDIVDPLTVDELETELKNMTRDDPHAGQDYVNAVRHYVLERAKRHLIWFLHTEGIKDKLDRLDRDVYAARLLVRDKEKRATEAGLLPEPLTLEELRALMPSPVKEVVAIRKQVLEASLADLRRDREKMEQEVALDVAKLRAAKAKYAEMLEQKRALEEKFKEQMRPLVQMDLTEVDEVLAHIEEMDIDAVDDLPPLS